MKAVHTEDVINSSVVRLGVEKKFCTYLVHSVHHIFDLNKLSSMNFGSLRHFSRSTKLVENGKMCIRIVLKWPKCVFTYALLEYKCLVSSCVKYHPVI